MSDHLCKGGDGLCPHSAEADGFCDQHHNGPDPRPSVTRRELDSLQSDYDRCASALERMTELQERTARERDEWRTKALDAGKHPAVVALMKELDAARAELKDARRGEAGLREALRRAWASIHDGCEPAAALNPAKCHPFCSEIRKALAGELAGEVGT